MEAVMGKSLEQSTARPGDTISVSGSRVGDRGRAGEILEILGQPDHLHYRVRWDNGREALFYPAGNVMIHHPLGRVLVRALAESGARYEILPHRRTMTAEAEARALDLPPQEVAKTVVLWTSQGFVRAVIAASNRLSLDKIRTLRGLEEGRLATEAELADAYPDFELGAVPPMGGPKDRLIVDRYLAESEWLVFEAGTHEESVCVRTEDLLRIAEAELADIAGDSG
jgi:Ala-tRNA(Pro) deacylase